MQSSTCACLGYVFNLIEMDARPDLLSALMMIIIIMMIMMILITSYYYTV